MYWLIRGWAEKRKNRPYDPEQQKLEVEKYKARLGCFATIIAALIVALATVLTKTPNSNGVEQPVIIVLIQAIFGVEAPRITSTLTPISAMGTETPTPVSFTDTPFATYISSPSATWTLVATSTPYPTNTPLPTYTPLPTHTMQPTYTIPTQSDTPTTAATIICLSYNELESLGSVIQPLESPVGTLAGAQIAFTQAWVAPTGWVIHKNSEEVPSVTAGDIASVWSPEACRPLIRTIEPSSVFYPLLLQDSVNVWTSYLGLSRGSNTVSNVPFEVGRELNTRGCRQEITATTVEVAAEIDSPRAVYFLVNAGNGFSTWEGRKIGELVLVFDTGQLVFDLTLGENLRDWVRNPQPGVVTTVTSPSTVEVSHGTAYDGREGRIDMITIAIPPAYRGSHLQSIRVVDITGGYPSSGTDPCVQVQAITVEAG